MHTAAIKAFSPSDGARQEQEGHIGKKFPSSYSFRSTISPGESSSAAPAKHNTVASTQRRPTRLGWSACRRMQPSKSAVAESPPRSSLQGGDRRAQENEDVPVELQSDLAELMGQA